MQCVPCVRGRRGGDGEGLLLRATLVKSEPRGKYQYLENL